MTRGLVGLLAVGLLVSGCGGNSDADELANAIGERIWVEVQPDVAQGNLPFEFTESDANCLGGAVVDSIGYETLTEAGVTAESVREGGIEDPASEFLSDPQAANAFVDGMTQCVDIVGPMSEQLAAEMAVSEESARCIGEGLMDQPAFRDAIVAAIVGGGSSDPFGDDPDAVGAMFDLMSECLTDEELTSILGG